MDVKYKDLKKKIKKFMSEKRFLHSLRVVKTAKELARHYQVDIKKVKIAALLHDTGYFMYENDKLNLAHSYYSYLYAKRLRIKDKGILEAIKWHTFAKRNMKTISKIVYIADKIEPNRNFKGIDKIRKEAFKDLDKSIYLMIKSTINYLKKDINQSTMELYYELENKYEKK